MQSPRVAISLQFCFVGVVGFGKARGEGFYKAPRKVPAGGSGCGAAAACAGCGAVAACFDCGAAAACCVGVLLCLPHCSLNNKGSQVALDEFEKGFTSERLTEVFSEVRL